MVTPKSLHARAMKALDRFEKTGDQCDLREALDLQARAALILGPTNSPEPSRSVMFRSSATLWMRSGDKVTASFVAKLGLMGDNVPPEIREELNEIVSQCEGGLV